MNDQRLDHLSEAATKAHARIQQDFMHIDPIIGVSRNMRASGFPADVMTIDCLKSGKRIILILNDEQPDIISYQFCLKDSDFSEALQSIGSEVMSAQLLYDWISGYFKQ